MPVLGKSQNWPDSYYPPFRPSTFVVQHRRKPLYINVFETDCRFGPIADRRSGTRQVQVGNPAGFSKAVATMG